MTFTVLKPCWRLNKLSLFASPAKGGLLLRQADMKGYARTRGAVDSYASIMVFDYFLTDRKPHSSSSVIIFPMQSLKELENFILIFFIKPNAVILN